MTRWLASPVSRRTGTAKELLGALLILGILGVDAPHAMANEAPAGLQRILDRQQAIEWRAALDRIMQADVVFVGEQHDDPATHRLERALLEGLDSRREKRVILSLEMFERDVQPVLDEYLQGKLSEADFLARSRPWNNYRTDYRPLIEYAKDKGLRVLAANVPRRLAARVAKEGPEALKDLTPPESTWAPKLPELTKGRLWERFKETMANHPGLNETDLERMYQAQGLKDVSMADAIARAVPADAASTLVLHINGAFHSDEGLGVPAQLSRLRPSLRQVITKAVPVQSTSESLPTESADLLFVMSQEEPQR